MTGSLLFLRVAAFAPNLDGGRVAADVRDRPSTCGGAAVSWQQIATTLGNRALLANVATFGNENATLLVRPVRFKR
jgi:hypothetical protein